ncbi:MAG: trypsin-like peptidase domain-containing protein [Solobacterium sp.]|nr:trypsin-like peptidase domain-containing protein [Solobacterium sp.]
MSEYRNPNETYYQYQEKPRRSHPFLTVLASAIVSLACGICGGWFAATHLGTGAAGETTVVYQAAETSSSAASNMSSGTQAMTITDAANKAIPSVVEIVIEETTQGYGFFGQSYTAQGAGSGVIISSDGYIVTNNHVVEGVDTITVTTYDGKEYPATLVGTDAKTDVAVIKVDAENLVPATIGDSSKIQVGDTALVIGNPLGTLGGTVTNGIISATSREIVINNESMDLIQTNAAINSGNSGGGMFDGNGNLIGIVNAKDSGTTSSGTLIEGLGFAIPINTAMDIAQQLIENGRVINRATLGVYLQQLNQDMNGYEAGLYITDIISGSGAEAAGLKPYDRILKVDDTDITNYTDLSTYLRNKKPGDTITLVIVRDNEQIDVNVTLTGTIDTETKQG